MKIERNVWIPDEWDYCDLADCPQCGAEGWEYLHYFEETVVMGEGDVKTGSKISGVECGRCGVRGQAMVTHHTEGSSLENWNALYRPAKGER